MSKVEEFSNGAQLDGKCCLKDARRLLPIYGVIPSMQSRKEALSAITSTILAIRTW